MRVVLVDDESPARARLRRLLEKYADVEVVGEARDGAEALEVVKAVAPDVAFVDIEMPVLNGFGLAEALQGEGPTLVFVTAYDQFALEAFDANAVDYLVKPVSEGRLAKTLARLRSRSEASAAKLAALLTAVRGERLLPKLAVRAGQRYLVLDLREVAAFVGNGDYTAIRCDGRELLVDESLDALERRLATGEPAATFLRVHRSAIINLAFLRELIREGDRKYVALLSDPFETRVSVSRERLRELKRRLGLGGDRGGVERSLR